FIKNLYEPFRPGKSEKHYLNVGRIAIAITLFGGIGVALFIDNLLELFKYIISIPAIFGASIWLGFIWRRLTKTAVFVQVIICLIIYAVIPNLLTNLDWAKTNQKFLAQTRPQTITITTGALTEDVENGLAEYTGQSIEKQHIIEPTGIFFEHVARIKPSDPNSPKIGIGRFQAEIWVLSWFGIDFSGFKKSQLVATRFFFDALFPFILLFLISFVTRPVEKTHLDRFFAKIHTPVQKTEEEEEKALADSYRNPEKFSKDKIFPRSNWEIMKPGKWDYIGFGGSWVLVGVIILLLWLMTSIQ
ncbi:MAG: sodium:solute symporter family protein, partial [Candidatus Aminicenantes bacterium]|nr:sodium:solute symporter family protein [Candidatus Aminicenantes bacterium]